MTTSAPTGISEEQAQALFTRLAHVNRIRAELDKMLECDACTEGRQQDYCDCLVPERCDLNFAHGMHYQCPRCSGTALTPPTTELARAIGLLLQDLDTPARMELETHALQQVTYAMAHYLGDASELRAVLGVLHGVEK